MDDQELKPLTAQVVATRGLGRLTAGRHVPLGRVGQCPVAAHYARPSSPVITMVTTENSSGLLGGQEFPPVGPRHESEVDLGCTGCAPVVLPCMAGTCIVVQVYSALESILVHIRPCSYSSLFMVVGTCMVLYTPLCTVLCT